MLQRFERAQNLAAQTERLLVDNEDIRFEDLRGMLDDRGTDRERLIDIDVQRERGVFAVPQLDDTWDPHKIDAGPKLETSNDR